MPFHLSAPFYSKTQELSLLSVSFSTPSPPALPHSLSNCASIPITPQNCSYQGSQKPHFCQTQWSLSDTADCFLHRETLSLGSQDSVSPGCAPRLSSLLTPPASKHPRSQGWPGLSALSYLCIPWWVGHVALNPSHAPRSLCSPSPLLSTSCVNPQAYLSSPLAHLTDLSKRELLIFIPQIMSPSALTPLFLTLHPSHQHTVSVQPQKHIQILPTSLAHLLPPLSALAWIIAAASCLPRLPDPTLAPNYQGSHMMVQMESCHSPAIARAFHGRENQSRRLKAYPLLRTHL